MDFVEMWPYMDIPADLPDYQYLDILYQRLLLLIPDLSWHKHVPDKKSICVTAAHILSRKLSQGEREYITESGFLWVGNGNPVKLDAEFSQGMFEYARLCLLPEYRCFLVQTDDGFEAHFQEMTIIE